jgi:hypothetical protein
MLRVSVCRCYTEYEKILGFRNAAGFKWDGPVGYYVALRIASTVKATTTADSIGLALGPSTMYSFTGHARPPSRNGHCVDFDEQLRRLWSKMSCAGFRVEDYFVAPTTRGCSGTFNAIMASMLVPQVFVSAADESPSSIAFSLHGGPGAPSCADASYPC